LEFLVTNLNPLIVNLFKVNYKVKLLSIGKKSGAMTSGKGFEAAISKVLPNYTTKAPPSGISSLASN